MVRQNEDLVAIDAVWPGLTTIAIRSSILPRGALMLLSIEGRWPLVLAIFFTGRPALPQCYGRCLFLRPLRL